MTIKNALIAPSLAPLALFGTAAAAAPDEGFYYLLCRGGTEMNPIIQPTEDSTQIILNFKPSSLAWKDAKALEIGECTWVDRKLTDNEPTKIRIDIPADIEATKTWSLNAKAFFFPFQKPVRGTVRRTTTRPAIQIMRESEGFTLKVLRPNASTNARPARGATAPSRSGPRAYEAIAAFEITTRSYFTFSVKADGDAFIVNRIIKGIVTGEEINVDDGSRVIDSPSPRDR